MGGSANYSYQPQAGMTLRDYFAGQALLGSLSADIGEAFTSGTHADYSYAVADAMIVAREVQP